MFKNKLVHFLINYLAQCFSLDIFTFHFAIEHQIRPITIIFICVMVLHFIHRKFTYIFVRKLVI